METSIWDSITFKDENKPNLLRLLRAQAKELADKTGGLLYAEVNPEDTADHKYTAPSINYNFYIHAPYLGNYRAKLFSIIEYADDSLFLRDEISRLKNSYELSSFAELIEKLEEVLSQSPQISNLISTLYLSSKEIKQNRR